MIFHIETRHPVAVDSNDHLYPRGTRTDNHANPKFNLKLTELIPNKPLWLMDLGCAGGAMVKSFVDGGNIAVGIEGSDYSLKARRAAWASIPGNLFTADATKPFTVHMGDGQPVQFHAITAWEFFEHIKEQDLPGVMDNICRHLAPGGWLIGTIANQQVRFNPDLSTKIVYHHTIKTAGWWTGFFRGYGFVERAGMVEYFSGAWVRSGPTKIVLQKGKA
jgi:2-polyprenyl-3-methyl-5-hydroxy-6-metoxy-1,4-benzoquinol methylase